MINFGEEISDFPLCCGRFSLKEIEAFSENFKLGSQRKEYPSVARPITRGRLSEVSPWRVRVISADGRILGEGMWCLADIEVSSAKTEECDC